MWIQTEDLTSNLCKLLATEAINISELPVHFESIFLRDPFYNHSVL